MTLTIGVDIGGTKIAAGLVDPSGRLVAEATVDTRADDPDAVLAAVVELVAGLTLHHQVEAIGIGAAGFVDAARSRVLFAPNIDWLDEPLAARVGAATGMPVVIENDANAAAWGEFRFGAGADSDHMLLVTVGTGIGGGLVHDGELYRGGFGLAGEIGHLRVVHDGLPCGCGGRGCFEQYGSGRALVREASAALTEQDPRADVLREFLVSRGAEHADTPVNGIAVTELAVQGDEFCIDLLAQTGRWLGVGIASLAAVLDPNVIALGGGVGAAGELILEPARRAFVDNLPAADSRPHAELRLATLGNRAGILGAADLARRR